MLPKVSILIPCYNAEKWIAEAIDSALKQTYSNKEVIVVDDGSVDNSLEIIKRFGEDIQWQAGPNKGGNAARNRLLSLSTGEWIQYLDADDYLLPKKIEEQIQFITSTPAADVVYSPSLMEYGSGMETYQTIQVIPEPHDPWILLACWHLPQTGSPLWRKQAIIDVGKWKVEQPCCQEHELYLRLLQANKQFYYFPQASSVYRQWSEETVCKKDKPEVFRQRLEIENRLETHLQESALLTPERQYAINQARFECARVIWSDAPEWASNLIQQVHRREQNFSPSGDAAPRLYRLIYKILGFDSAEKIALLQRTLPHKFRRRKLSQQA